MPNDRKTHNAKAATRAGRLAGKTAVITGGAAGMGRATALAFANEGAAVAILDIQRDAGEEVVRLIRESGGTAEFIEADVSDARQVDGAFDRVAKTVGPYDILFNHAGTITVKPLHETTEADSSLTEDTQQLVVLGAGFDTRAYRLPCLRGIHVFEVDHPDTQSAKRRVLERALSDPPENVRFVACNFDERDLESAMSAAGFRESARSFILWEGVTGYLTEDAVDATLQWCARACPDSLLLFTYLHRDVLTRPEAFVGTERLFAALDRAGEQLKFGIDPGDLAEFLAERGLSLESDVGAAEYRERYFGEASRRMRGHEFYRVALARVALRA